MTRWRQHLLYTKASAIFECCLSLVDDGDSAAMHGNEDGSVPATFQIIFMVGKIVVLLSLLFIVNLDRMETLANDTGAAQEGVCEEKPQRCAVDPAGAGPSSESESSSVSATSA